MTHQEYYISFILALLFGYSMLSASYSITVPFYNWERNQKRGLFKKNNVLFQNKPYLETDTFLVATPGCYIPNYLLKFKYNYTGQGFRHSEYACGVRAVFVDYVANNQIRFRVDKYKMQKYNKKAKYSCCYKFAYTTYPYFASAGQNQNQLAFTKCKFFKTGTTVTLEHEIISVSCSLVKQKRKEIYNDAYIVLKNMNVHDADKNHTTWNVLMLGIHSMSRARVIDTMPHTFKYIKNRNWLDFRGYQKVGSTTFPNLMALLTGRNYSAIMANCTAGLSKCAEYFIWNKYMAPGYITAYGEDYLELPDTLSKFGGFKIKPTHHYMRPFFQLGEKRQEETICLRRQASATHLLKYAYDFASTYNFQNNFFGVFWINSYTSRGTDNPSILDQELASWLLKLQSNGILKNTFVILFSDHGNRYGDTKIPIESYYDERLPMLFIWVPHGFRKQHSQKHTNIVLNQHRLVTPYDLYVTLGHILKLTNSASKVTDSDACPRCSSLFKLKSLRWTCADARVSENGCSCRNMSSLQPSATETEFSLQLSISFINNVTFSVKTIPCMTCKRLKLSTLLRSHTFHNRGRLYNVIAFEMSNGVRFESTVIYRGDKSRILDLHTITAYHKNANCVIDPTDQPYCDCESFDCDPNNELLNLPNTKNSVNADPMWET